MTDKQDEILSTLAVGYQKLDDRQAVIEDVFRDSLIIPGSKLHAILSTLIIIVLTGGFTFAFAFWLIRPI
ncbi:hypothetical protein KA005_63905 [bacterium]|nr:hypothetical protein [bacterium]